MSEQWEVDTPVKEINFGPGGYWRVFRRGSALLLVILSGLILMMLLRIVEQPLFRDKRPVTPYITQVVCRCAFFILGIKFTSRGTPMNYPGVIVSNHAGWLDIFSLNSRKRVYFVSKSEVANWPFIGWLARATGTVFIKRDRRDTANQIKLFRNRLTSGHRLVFFPEGTSSDSLRILPFKSTLFGAFFSDDLKASTWVQPVTLCYAAPCGADPRFYGWWGDMDFAPHLLQTLKVRKQGRVCVHYLEPVRVSNFDNRKQLASYCEEAIRQKLIEHVGS